MVRLEPMRAAARAVATAMILAGACLPAGAATFPDAQAPEMRVASIGYRLATRGRELCPRKGPVTGLLLHDLGAYPAELRRAIAQQFTMRDGMGVRGVVAGSVAARAGFAAGDEIIALNGVPVASLGLPPLRPAASYDRVESFLGLLLAGLAQGSATLDVRRADAVRPLTLPLDTGCAAAVALVPGSKPDAWSDAHYAAVTQGLAEAAGDDELAFALAHEMAHVVLRHAAEPHGMLTGIGIGGKRSREREREADRLGIEMAIAAGYSASGAHALLARFARANGPAISLTHPTVRARLEAIDEVVRHSGSKPASP